MPRLSRDASDDWRSNSGSWRTRSTKVATASRRSGATIALDQGVLGGQDHEGHAEGGVGAGGEDLDALVRPGDGHVELGALGPADPVALHGLDPLGPLQVLQVGQQLVGVGGDAEEPLLQVLFHHQVTAALACPVRPHLLVGQHGGAPRAPVDGRLFAVGQPRLQEAQEDDLVEAHVDGVVAAHHPAPVVARAQPAQRALQLGDAGLGEGAGVGARLDGGVLGRQAEAVEADRAEHREALHGAPADVEVAEGVVAHVALVGGAAGVGVHAQHVEGRPGVVVGHFVGVFLGPPGLPAALDLRCVVGVDHGSPGYAKRRRPPSGPQPLRPQPPAAPAVPCLLWQERRLPSR